MKSTVIENIQVDVNNEPYEVDINLVWSSDPGVHTLRNGDPGYPGSFEYDFQIIHAFLFDENGNKSEVDSSKFDSIYPEVESYLDKMDDLEFKLEEGLL